MVYPAGNGLTLTVLSSEPVTSLRLSGLNWTLLTAPCQSVSDRYGSSCIRYIKAASTTPGMLGTLLQRVWYIRYIATTPGISGTLLQQVWYIGYIAAESTNLVTCCSTTPGEPSAPVTPPSSPAPTAWKIGFNPVKQNHKSHQLNHPTPVRRALAAQQGDLTVVSLEAEARRVPVLENWTSSTGPEWPVYLGQGCSTSLL